MHVVVGTDSYGRVKAVKKTAIVTSFSMVQMLPVVPIKSYYVWGRAESEESGVPLLASVRNVKLRGLPLARVDRMSVLLAYIRAAFAAMVLFGFIGTLIGLLLSANKPLDEFAMNGIRLAEVSLGAGVACGIATYFVPTLSRRERTIRTYCGEILPACVDPGRLAPDYANAIRELLAEPGNPEPVGLPQHRFDLMRALILTRCDAGITGEPQYESVTDDLLEQLRHLNRTALRPGEL